MKNLNIYTFRELIKMYLDDRPMPDVAFVTQTEAMKLQSIGKEMNNNSEWITDRKPTRDDADCTGFVWITTEYGVVLREPWKTVRDRPWMPITPPEPYVKPSRFEIYGAVGVWGVRDNNGFDIIGFISRDDAKHAKWAVEQLEKVIP